MLPKSLFQGDCTTYGRLPQETRAIQLVSQFHVLTFKLAKKKFTAQHLGSEIFDK